MANPVGTCHLCGQYGKLSFEHVPPKAAFNDTGILQAALTEWLSADNGREAPMRQSQKRRGSGDYTLRERCNNDTGAWYVADYVDWAYQGMRFAQAGGSSLALPLRIFPGRIAKQIICMFTSANGKGFTKASPELAKYVLDRDSIGIPDRFRLYCYLIHPQSTSARQTGIVSRLRGSNVKTFSEIAFRPFGYILDLGGDDPDDHELTDITFFTHHSWRDYRELHLRFPLREVATYFPADFRTRAEWDAVRRKTRAEAAASAETKGDDDRSA